MNQYNTGITFTLKKDKIIRPLDSKSKNKKLHDSNKPKNTKALLISKENPISPQTQICTNLITVEESSSKPNL